MALNRHGKGAERGELDSPIIKGCRNKEKMSNGNRRKEIEIYYTVLLSIVASVV